MHITYQIPRPFDSTYYLARSHYLSQVKASTKRTPKTTKGKCQINANNLVYEHFNSMT
jgi:hypothetical protein